MRYVGIALVILSLPAFYVWLRSDRRNYRYAYFAIGLLPFLLTALNLDASLWDIGGLGYAKGLVVTLLDTLCLAILATTRHTVFRLPFSWVFAAYIVAVLLSMLPAPGIMPPFVYAFQVMRAFLVFVTVATVVQQKDALRYIAYGLAAGAIIQGVATIGQRASGTFQAAGTMGHQNLTGMVLHFATLPLLALLLAGDRSKMYLLGIAGGLAAVALGASRGSVVFLAVGLALLLVLSIMRHPTTRKFGVAAISVFMMAVASPVIIAGLEMRVSSLQEGFEKDGERVAFEEAARAMWSDHPMGVGANRYTLVANVGRYSERAGVTWAAGSRNAVVHHLYLLTAAETGWLGLFALIALFTWVVSRGFRFALTYRRDPRGDIVLGCACAVTVTALHSFYEWVWVMSITQYVFAIALGIMSGFMFQRQAERTKARRDAGRVKAEAARTKQAELARVAKPATGA